MNIGLIIFGITALFIYNAYHDQYFTKMFHANKKHITIFMYICIGLSAYILIKNKPKFSHNYLMSAYNAFKYLPISKTIPLEVIEPLIQDHSLLYSSNVNNSSNNSNTLSTKSLENRILQSGNRNSTKRSVSETKKKYVAASQSWKCGDCDNQLSAWFEVDHKVRLEHGGTNDVSNLVALCRECHGRKTAMENMKN